MSTQCETCSRVAANSCERPEWRTEQAFKGKCRLYRKDKGALPAAIGMALQPAISPESQPPIPTPIRRLPDRALIKRTYSIFEDQETWIKEEALRRYKKTRQVVSEAAIVREALDNLMKG